MDEVPLAALDAGLRVVVHGRVDLRGHRYSRTHRHFDASVPGEHHACALARQDGMNRPLAGIPIRKDDFQRARLDEGANGGGVTVERRQADGGDAVSIRRRGFRAGTEQQPHQLTVTAEGDPALRERYEEHGVECVEVDVSELIKGGGGIHCMTGFLKREPL